MDKDFSKYYKDALNFELSELKYSIVVEINRYIKLLKRKHNKWLFFLYFWHSKLVNDSYDRLKDLRAQMVAIEAKLKE